MGIAALILEIAALLLSLRKNAAENDIHFLLLILLLSLGVILALVSLISSQKTASRRD